MRREIKKSLGGLWYAIDWPTIPHPLNNVIIACIQGSGEQGDYNASDMIAEVTRIVNKNGFAQDAANGIELPFIVISPLAGIGKDIADHSLIAAELGNVVKLYKKDYAFLMGLSQGGQTTMGFAFQCRNSTEITKQIESSYKNAQVFDGFVCLSGKIPGTPDIDHFPNIPLFVCGATGDNAVPISNQLSIASRANASVLRTDDLYPNYIKKTVNGVVTWVPVDYPAGSLNRMVVIIGGGHGTSWNMAYDWYAKTGPGLELNQWVTKIAKPKSIECNATLDVFNGMATFHLETGDVQYSIIKTT